MQSLIPKRGLRRLRLLKHMNEPDVESLVSTLRGRVERGEGSLEEHLRSLFEETVRYRITDERHNNIVFYAGELRALHIKVKDPYPLAESADIVCDGDAYCQRLDMAMGIAKAVVAEQMWSWCGANREKISMATAGGVVDELFKQVLPLFTTRELMTSGDSDLFGEVLRLDGTVEANMAENLHIMVNERGGVSINLVDKIKKQTKNKAVSIEARMSYSNITDTTRLQIVAKKYRTENDHYRVSMVGALTTYDRQAALRDAYFSGHPEAILPRDGIAWLIEDGGLDAYYQRMTPPPAFTSTTKDVIHVLLTEILDWKEQVQVAVPFLITDADIRHAVDKVRRAEVTTEEIRFGVENY
jgi:hypothetical protein